MLIGLMGDSHDNLPKTREAVAFMNERPVELVLHTGDYVSPFVIPILGSLKAPMIGVFGNNDGDREMLITRSAQEIGIEIRGNFTDLSADSLRIGLLHGQEESLLGSLRASGYFDLIVCGHTHRPVSERAGNTLVANPGEICGYLTGMSTVAVFDTIRGDLKHSML
jgi:putative phosphoesterase